MYQDYWNLQESPFRTAAGLKYFYKGQTHEEALARLWFLAEDNRRLGLLLGVPGSGKSLTLKAFGEEARCAGYAVAAVNLAGIDGREFLWTLAADLRTDPPLAEDAFSLWHRLTDRLVENSFERRHTLLLLDDADCAEQDVASLLLRLLHFDTEPPIPLITFVLAASLPLRRSLRPRLLDRVELRIDLEPWEEEDTREFLQQAATRARVPGAGPEEPLFDGPAAVRLHQLTGGVPRRVCRLADLALLAATGQQLSHVDAETVANAHYELSVAAWAPTCGNGHGGQEDALLGVS